MARSLFARTAGLFLALIIAFQMLLFLLSWYFIMRPLLAGSVNDLAALMTLSAKTWAELPHERRAGYQEELHVRHQLDVGPAIGDVRGESSRLPYLRMLEEALGARTGVPTHIVIEAGDPPRYVLDLPAGRDTLRYRFTHERIGTNPGLAFATVVGGSVLLGVLAALLVARGLTRPLGRLADATARVGRCDDYVPLPEDGPRELATLAREFNRMTQNVRELLENRTTLLAGVSHDLRSPITRLRLALEMLRVQPDPALHARMEQDLETLNELIGMFLDFSRGVSGEPLQTIDVSSLLETLAGEVRTRGATVLFEVWISCRKMLPPLALRRVLANFIDNAARYGAGSAIEIELRVTSGEVTVDVLDRGHGVPPEQCESVFRPFVRLESSRNAVTGGSGLGLAIARQIAQAQGWRVSLMPRPGGGTIARLRIPRV